MILGTGFLGFILTWMRERTGSLAVPVVFHNISHAAQSFVWARRGNKHRKTGKPNKLGLRAHRKRTHTKRLLLTQSGHKQNRIEGRMIACNTASLISALKYFGHSDESEERFLPWPTETK